MEQGKESPWSGTLAGIAALIALPFALLAWLLASTISDHGARYQRMSEVLDTFRAGMAVVVPLETLRDLAPTASYLGNRSALAMREQAHAQAGQRLQVFLARVRALDNASLTGSADRMAQAWAGINTDAGEMAATVVPFENAERFNDELYGLLASLFFVSDMAAGDAVNANELLMLALDTNRKVRREVGLMRAIAVYTALRDGYITSSDAEYVDNAWNTLEMLADTLTTQLTSINDRHGDGTLPAPARVEAINAYLAHTEEFLLLAPQVTLGSETAWREGERALAAARTIGDDLLDGATRLVDEEYAAQRRVDIAAAGGLLLLYLAITTLAVMFYRTRYAAMRAQADNRAKSLFLARMSHEIRTPLNGVIGLAELLADTGPTPRQREYIELIGSAGRSLVSLVNDILDHAKIEAGKLELDQAPVDIRSLLAESAQVFSLRAGQNRTLIFCEVDDAVPEHMLGDAVRIRQVLLNLIANAVKFTEQGRVEVCAELAAGNDGSTRLRVEVRDTGIGLTPTEQQKLFNLFTQASPDVARRFGGTGLGLSISRELVHMMQGSIGVYSGVGSGSVFWFELPLREPPDAPPAAPSHALPSLPQSVLLVDGDGHLAQAVATLPPAITRRVSTTANELDAQRVLDVHPELGFVVINGQRHPEDAVTMAQHIVAFHPGAVIRVLTAVGVDTSRTGLRDPAVSEFTSRSVFTREQLVALLTPDDARPDNIDMVAAGTAAVLPTGMRVLVAEDNPVNQLVTRGLLRKLGIEAEIAEDGRRAVDLYAAAPLSWDLVLMDLDMPVLDGNGAAREIRRLEAQAGWPRCPILALSAHALPEFGVLARRSGMDGQVVKPVTLATLADALTRHYQPLRTEARQRTQG